MCPSKVTMDVFEGLEEFEKMMEEKISNKVQMMIQLVSQNKAYRQNKREVLQQMNATRENIVVIEELIRSPKVVDLVNKKDKVLVKEDYEDKRLGFGTKIPNLLLAKSEVILASFNQNQLKSSKKQFRTETEVELANNEIVEIIRKDTEKVMRAAMKEAYKIEKVDLSRKEAAPELPKVKLNKQPSIIPLLEPKHKLKSHLAAMQKLGKRGGLSIGDFKRQFRLRERRVIEKNVEEVIKKASSLFEVSHKFAATLRAKATKPVYSMLIDRNKVNLRVENAKL